MKYRHSAFLIGLLVLTVALQSSGTVLAYDFGAQGLINNVKQWQNQSSKSAARQQVQLQDVIHRADTLIGNRITSLNNLNTRVQDDARLSPAEKSSLASEIQADITGLTALKATIDADTDITKARSDAKQIITGYYIYAVFEPKIRLLTVLGNLQTVTANLQALIPQIQSLINTFQSQGKDVSPLQTLLNDASSQLQTINTTLANDTTTVQNVSVTTQGTQAIFSQVHQDIAQIVKTGFAKVRSDFTQMRTLFHQLVFNRPAPTSTTTPSTPTVTPTSNTTTQ